MENQKVARPFPSPSIGAANTGAGAANAKPVESASDIEAFILRVLNVTDTLKFNIGGDLVALHNRAYGSEMSLATAPDQISKDTPAGSLNRMYNALSELEAVVHRIEDVKNTLSNIA